MIIDYGVFGPELIYLIMRSSWSMARIIFLIMITASDSLLLKNFDNFEIFDYFWDFWDFWEFLRFLIFLIIFDIFENLWDFWDFWRFLWFLRISYPKSNFWRWWMSMSSYCNQWWLVVFARRRPMNYSRSIYLSLI